MLAAAGVGNKCRTRKKTCPVTLILFETNRYAFPRPTTHFLHCEIRTILAKNALAENAKFVKC